MFIEDGKLILEGRYEDPPLPNGAAISSGKIHTHGKYDIEYGRIEIAVALPKGQGAWPSMFMLVSATQLQKCVTLRRSSPCP